MMNKTKKKPIINLTVVIPVHTVSDENFTDMLNKALLSIEHNEVHPTKVLITICECEDVIEYFKTFDEKSYGFKIEIVKNNTGSDFQNQINYGVEKVKTEYFTFLEFDDELSVNWLKNVQIYIEAYPDVDMFLPIISDYTTQNQFIGFTNEAAWAYNFSEKHGFIDHEVLLEYPNINPDGMVVKKTTFKDVGGYKSNIRFSFNYEFLLRFTYNTKTIMVIPKVGYKHIHMRPNSLFYNYKYSEISKIKPEEVKFWMEAAKKECFFNQDREITMNLSLSQP